MHVKGRLLLFKRLGFLTLRELRRFCQVTKGALTQSLGTVIPREKFGPLLISMGAGKNPIRNQVVDSTFPNFNACSMVAPRIQHTGRRCLEGLWRQKSQPGFHQTGFACGGGAEPYGLYRDAGREDREKAMANGDVAADSF